MTTLLTIYELNWVTSIISTIVQNVFFRSQLLMSMLEWSEFIAEEVCFIFSWTEELISTLKLLSEYGANLTDAWINLNINQLNEMKRNQHSFVKDFEEIFPHVFEGKI